MSSTTSDNGIWPATAPASQLLDEIDEDQAIALADFVDLEAFDAGLLDVGATPEALPHLPQIETAAHGGANLTAVRAEHPRALAASLELEAAIMTGTSSLNELDRAMIGFVVAYENNCQYWQIHLGRRLRRFMTTAEITRFITDWTEADLALRQRAMLAFAVRLALVPAHMTSEDAEMLTNIGLSDRDVLDLVDVVSYWSFATRVVEGLGVPVEPWFGSADQGAVTQN